MYVLVIEDDKIVNENIDFSIDFTFRLNNDKIAIA